MKNVKCAESAEDAKKPRTRQPPRLGEAIAILDASNLSKLHLFFLILSELTVHNFWSFLLRQFLPCVLSYLFHISQQLRHGHSRCSVENKATAAHCQIMFIQQNLPTVFIYFHNILQLKESNMRTRENLFFNYGPLNKVNIHELQEPSLVIICPGQAGRRVGPAL